VDGILLHSRASILIGAVLLVSGVGAGIIWLTWDHMDAIWSMSGGFAIDNGADGNLPAVFFL
jgi:hypothetical protein